MAEKTISNVRVINKHDIEENWLKATGFTPKQGELIVYDIDDNYNYERLKIGDGVHNVNNLPFVSDVFIVNITGDDTNGYAADRTFAETSVACDNGKVVIAKYKTVVMPLTSKSSMSINFTNNRGSANDIYVMLSTGIVNKASYQLQQTSSTTLTTTSKMIVGAINELNEKTTKQDTAISTISSLVGDTPVSDQIEAAQMVYVGPDMPTDPNIKVWINTAEEGTGIVPVLPRVSTITLSASAWTGNTEPYSQQVEIATVTTASKIDLQPTAQQIVDLQNAEISLMVENKGGVVTCYAIGNKPTADYTMQVLIQEVSYV